MELELIYPVTILDLEPTNSQEEINLKRIYHITKQNTR